MSDAMDTLRDFPVAELEHATLDTHRALRRGFPEVVLADGKTHEQLVGIVTNLLKRDGDILVTRISADESKAVVAECPHPSAEIDDQANLLIYRREPFVDRGRGMIAVISAGTSDHGPAEEAAVTAELMGNKVERVRDVGVAGIHRLLAKRDVMNAARIIIVAAGMEGALASVVAGLVNVPVIAVPTSVGYGASFNGLAALLGMLSACAAGITVVNIDNGFGAGYAAALMNRRDDA